MIKDLENRKIKMMYKPNAHQLITGKSGTGKTYYCCRKLEEEIKKNKAILLIDYSNSYTYEELQKNKFRYENKMEIFELFDGKEIEFHLNAKAIAGTATDALIHALDVGSYYQKKILSEAIADIIRNFGYLKIEHLFSHLEMMVDVEDISAECKKNVGHLLTRLAPYKEICEIRLKSTPKEKIEKAEGLTIIQLSDFPELQRKFVTKFLLEVIWREIRSDSQKWDFILLDEFQNLSVRSGTALSAMLREGRKFGLGVWLSSQFLSNYSQDELDTLMQAGNMMFFKPVEREMSLNAKLINFNDYLRWFDILLNLQVGEMVLKGRYLVNENLREIETPIICQVEVD